MSVPARDASPYPPPAACLPHAGEMMLLDEILSAGELFCECSLRVPQRSLLHNELGEVPAGVAVEYMAQCAAAYAAVSQPAAAPRVGFLLGTRRLACFCESFYPGQELRVRAELSCRLGAMCTFQCTLHDAADNVLLAEAALNVYVADSPPGTPGSEE